MKELCVCARERDSPSSSRSNCPLMAVVVEGRSSAKGRTGPGGPARVPEGPPARWLDGSGASVRVRNGSRLRLRRQRAARCLRLHRQAEARGLGPHCPQRPHLSDRNISRNNVNYMHMTVRRRQQSAHLSLKLENTALPLLRIAITIFMILVNIMLLQREQAVNDSGRVRGRVRPDLK